MNKTKSYFDCLTFKIRQYDLSHKDKNCITVCIYPDLYVYSGFGFYYDENSGIAKIYEKFKNKPRSLKRKIAKYIANSYGLIYFWTKVKS